MVGQFKKAYLHRPVTILHFLTPARIQKCLTEFQNILASLTINHLQAESRIYQGIFLHIIPVRIIAPYIYKPIKILTQKRFHIHAPPQIYVHY